MTAPNGGNTAPAPSIADRLASLIDDVVDDQPTGEAPPAPNEEQAPPAPPEEPAPTDEPTDDEPSDEADPNAPPTPAPATIKLTLDGKEEELPLEEVAKGYLRQGDYTRKTQALADQRKAAEAEFAAMRQDRQELASTLTQLRTTVEQNTPKEPDWAKLRVELDPAEYAAVHADWSLHNSRLAQLRAAEQEANRKVEADQAEERRTKIVAEQEKLLIALPDWQKDEVRTKEQAELTAYAAEMGLPQDFLKNVDDHRLIKVMRNSMKWEAAQKAAKAPKPASTTATPAAPAVRPAKPGAAAPRVTGSEIEQKKALSQFRKTGSVVDAGRALAGLID